MKKICKLKEVKMLRLFENEIENMRDLGGYKTEENKAIKYNRIIRSNLPENLSDGSIKKLIEQNITTVIDLRSKEEIERKKGVFFDNNFFNYYNIEINGGGRIPDTENDILNSYIEMLNGEDSIYKIFNIIAESNNGVIYYCNAGKDRTGLVTALILKLLGVGNNEIVEDYLLSGIYLEKMLKEFSEKSHINNILEIITPKKETMYNLLMYIEKEYMGVEMYLKKIGISENDIIKIKSKNLIEIKE